MVKTMKERYQAIQDEANDWDDFTTYNDVIEIVEGHLDVDILGDTSMERFAYSLAHHAYQGTLVQPEPSEATS